MESPRGLQTNGFAGGTSTSGRYTARLSVRRTPNRRRATGPLNRRAHTGRCSRTGIGLARPGGSRRARPRVGLLRSSPRSALFSMYPEDEPASTSPRGPNGPASPGTRGLLPRASLAAVLKTRSQRSAGAVPRRAADRARGSRLPQPPPRDRRAAHLVTERDDRFSASIASSIAKHARAWVNECLSEVLEAAGHST